MRRGIGAAGIFARKELDQKKESVGESLRLSRANQIAEGLDLLKTKLQKFSSKYRDRILADESLCEAFLEICFALGIDPLVSDKSVWDGIFGGGRFLPEVAVQVLACLRNTRDLNGGIMSLNAVASGVNRMRGDRYATVTEADVIRACRELRVLGEGVLWTQDRFVFYLPDGVSPDSLLILSAIHEKGVKRSEIPKFGKAREDIAITGLIRDGAVWVDLGEVSEKGSLADRCLRQEASYWLSPEESGFSLQLN